MSSELERARTAYEHWGDIAMEQDPKACTDYIEALEAENARLREYAHEATKVITNLAGGGSELFGKELSGIFLADLSACAKRIRDRHERVHKICRDIARRAREGGNADG